MSEQEFVQGSHVGGFPCPICHSTDNLQIWIKEDENGVDYYDGKCFTPSCKAYWSNNELVEQGVITGEFTVDKSKLKEPKKRPTPQEAKMLARDLFKRTVAPEKYRGIRKETFQFFGDRAEVDGNGNIKRIWYAETYQGEVQGFKPRTLPKVFGFPNIGFTGSQNDLSGQWKFPNGGRFVVIVGGENDRSAAFQMLRDYQINKNQEDYDPIAVVSPTCGEGSAANQCRRHYDWFDKFDNIIVGMDNDEAGWAATEEIVKVLPKDKVKVATWSLKDPHKMLEEGKEKQFISNFWDAVSVTGSSVKTSKQADAEMELELSRESIPLPPFMKDLEDAMAGGIRLGYLVVLAAQTGGGKTTIVNEALYYWLFNSPYKVGILSLELNAGQYQTVMLSRHIGTNINMIPTPAERVSFVQQDWVKEKRKELRETEYGEPRFSLLDERDGDLLAIRRQIELMKRRDECEVFIIDPVQDLFEGVSVEEQTAFIKWLKVFVKEGNTVIAIAHITKGRTEIDKQTGKRIMRVLTEDDLAGVSNLAKSSGCTILTSRDKYSDDPIEKNTTYPTVGKCRWSGFTGDVNPWIYCRETHTMYDKEEYLNKQDTPTLVQNVDNPPLNDDNEEVIF